MKSANAHSNTETVRSGVRNNRLHKLDAPHIQADLTRWLFTDKLTYEQIRARLKEQFSLSVGVSTLHKFYHRHNVAAVETARNGETVLLDIVIQPTAPIRLRIVQDRPEGGAK